MEITLISPCRHCWPNDCNCFYRRGKMIRDWYDEEEWLTHEPEPYPMWGEEE